MNRYALGLLGYPVSHSLSPKLHQAALMAAGLEGAYWLYPVPPGEGGGELLELKELLGKVRAGEVQGLNVTIPHKQTVIPYLDELTPTARAIGAVNTIYLREDKLIGDNTDAPGFLADLRGFLEGRPLTADRGVPFPVSGIRSALVLGAGGSARAVVYALLQDGWNISLYARRPEQAEALTTHFSPFIKTSQSFTIQNSLFTIDHSLIVNTTPLGMTPHLDTSPWPADLPFLEHAAVYDLVYNPRETKLVRDARAAGLPATTGLGMLIEQAALGFKIWTGREADREGMREAVK
ncbi:MAG TPA: shikimate dehydrogenase [Anaerolineales bacterium]|nr:shikimate dehydrogenase [Anaerolineales bacterium]